MGKMVITTLAGRIKVALPDLLGLHSHHLPPTAA